MESNEMLHDVRCKCGRLLGKINGRYEIKCSRCKLLQSGVSPKPIVKSIVAKPYNKETGE